MNFSIAMNADRKVVTSLECRQFAGKRAGMAQILRVGSRGIALGDVRGAERQTQGSANDNVLYNTSPLLRLYR